VVGRGGGEKVRHRWREGREGERLREGRESSARERTSRILRRLVRDQEARLSLLGDMLVRVSRVIATELNDKEAEKMIPKKV